MGQLAIETEYALQCLIAGNYEEAYKTLQDVKDELIVRAVKELNEIATNESFSS